MNPHLFRGLFLNSVACARVIFDWERFFESDCKISFKEVPIQECLDWELSMETIESGSLNSLKTVISNGAWERESRNWSKSSSGAKISIDSFFNPETRGFPLVILQHEDGFRQFIMDGQHRAAELTRLYIEEGVGSHLQIFLLRHPSASQLLHDWKIRP